MKIKKREVDVDLDVLGSVYMFILITCSTNTVGGHAMQLKCMHVHPFKPCLFNDLGLMPHRHDDDDVDLRSTRKSEPWS